ncbi:MAG: tetratricopeptide repeat protein [Humidesulfovibrio sp.]|uniref:tetratricopeptide repeat protein n=1 Tax=Humidesulfovibrio sp. TaxID=2910988 RepID=UPI0027EF4D59|nr:tetratricopeptide repeat protein [Humidesulfovibrio sp.]MDQ7835412.1 tetratricopeptide repeat protein [Humidesulfovibrio sp.]
MKSVHVMLRMAVLAALFVWCLAQPTAQALAAQTPAEVAAAMQARLDKDPADLDAKAQLANALIQTGDIAKAETLVQEVLAAQPGHPMGSYVLGNVLVTKGETAKAIAVLRGVRDETKPLVRRAVAQFVTLLEMTESARLAQEALKAEQAGQPAAVAPGSIAVFPYGDLSPDKQYAPLRKALTAMLISDLSAAKSLKVLERVRLQALYDEMGLGKAGALDAQTAPRLGRILGAQSVVTGNLGGALTATTSLVERTGKPAINFAVDQAPDKFFQLEKDTASQLLAKLGVQPDAAEARSLRMPQTKDLQSVMLYGQGLDALDAGQWQSAADFFKKALARDPFFDLAAGALDSTPPRDAPTLAQFSAMSSLQRGGIFGGSLAAAAAAQAAANAAAARAVSFGCFTRDTQVAMADGSFRPITSLQLGDMVQSFDAATKTHVARPVVQKLVFEQNHYLLLNGQLKLTESHPVLKADGTWAEAKNLRPGDRLTGRDGLIDVRSLERVGTDEYVFNFEIAKSHTYLIRGAGGTVYVVHNAKGGS